MKWRMDVPLYEFSSFTAKAVKPPHHLDKNTKGIHAYRRWPLVFSVKDIALKGLHRIWIPILPHYSSRRHTCNTFAATAQPLKIFHLILENEQYGPTAI